MGLFNFRRKTRANRIPVLAYHALNAPGIDYESNDHIALEEDLRVIRRLGFSIAPLTQIARYTFSSARSPLDRGKWVGLSFDDGTDYDFLDFDHPVIGHIKSFKTILEEWSASAPRAKDAATGVSFVIASPQARKVLDQVCIGGPDRWRDSWWASAAEGGTICIGNHSWDHTHPALERIAQRDQLKGTFYGIDNLNDAMAQIVQAQNYIDELTHSKNTKLFAYPYGHVPDFLVNEYFPRYQREHRLVAAFSTDGDYATRGTNRWRVPRFVCQAHWKSPEGLAKILEAAMGT
jgi:polysaccharide deacetylase